MIGWPMYRLIKNVSKRGRLPDMKPIRVTISATLVAVALFVVFFIPMPVTRVRQHGVVQVQPTEITHLSVEVPGVLKELLVKEGQHIKRGQRIAVFYSYDLENQRDQALTQKDIKWAVIKDYEEQMRAEQDEGKKSQLKNQLLRAKDEHSKAEVALKQTMAEMERLVLRSPRDGVVLNLPQIDEIGKRFGDKDQDPNFCSIGDATKLRVLVPLSGSDYDLVQENQKKLKELDVTIRVQGHDSRTWKGTISQLPKQDSPEIPPQLSTKFNGPIAVKPGSPQGKMLPQGQVFLVGVDIKWDDEKKPDDTIAINSLAQVKIHNEYRSCAWWIWRTVTGAFDLHLWKP